MPKKDWIRKSKKETKPFAWDLFFLVLGLTGFGLLMVYNASVVEAFRVFNDEYYYLKNQLLWLAIGIFFMILFSKINHLKLKKIALPLFLVNIILMILVLIPGIGLQLKGARRWLDLGFFVLQPSELLKLTLTIYLATWLETKKSIWQFTLICFVIALLIALQPDLGTLTVIVAEAIIIYFFSGVSLLNLLFLGIFSSLGGALMIFSSAYRKNRVLTFLNPTIDTLGTSYHIRQILIALGAGGLFGLGLGQSRQKYAYLPEATTDSIFAVIAEELGFLGASLVILVFLIIIIKGFMIAGRQTNKYSYLLACGIISWVAIQTIINLAAMVTLVPLTGLPLPFISYGGSSLIAVMTGMGIVLNIAKEQNV